VGLGAAAVEGLVSADRPACRFCAAPLTQTFVDLGLSPLANSLLSEADLVREEPRYPLHAYVCGNCLLVQLGEFASPQDIFEDYVYFSSFSDSWVEHARRYVEQMIERFGFDARSSVVEIASNDGYLLQWFVERGVPVLGVEPAANVAAAAEAKGIPTLVRFFSEQTARELVEQGLDADLVIGNNVLAHVPALNDFVAGLEVLLAPDGVVTMEFPHLLRLIAETEFDTIYHEHFSYFSALTVERVFAAHGLRLFDVEELPTHGGSLRIYAAHADSDAHADTGRVAELVERERAAGLADLASYARFDERVREVRKGLREFLEGKRAEGRSVAAYGAAAKGVTLLNYCGIGPELVEYVADRSPHKQGRYLPGVRLPIRPPEHVAGTKPDFLLLLAWNLKEEIVEQMSHVREWGGRFVTPVPEVAVHE
jgi:2-polyprenyl-3-methyl-5-hydroxy-6-metoxy-1,4-benzoquinol methylase